MQTITAKQLHQETKSVLDQLERGDPVLVTRNGRAIARLEPVAGERKSAWEDVMTDIWSAQKQITPAKRVENPVLAERKRRR